MTLVIMNKKLLYISSASGVIQLVFSSFLLLFSISVLISKLGSEIYGVFSILTLLGTINVFTNLGINSSLIKYIAEQGKTQESNYDIFITLLILLIFSGLMAIILFSFKRVIILNILSIPQKYYLQSELLYSSLIISNVLLLIGQTFSAVISALQKVFINNFLMIIYNAFYYGSIILLLEIGYGIEIIGPTLLLTSILWFFLTVVFFYKYWGSIHIAGISKNFLRIVKKQLKYGGRIYLAGIGGFLFEPMTKILISNLIGLREVGYFDISIKVRNLFQGLLTRLFDPFFPFISQEGNIDRIRFLVRNIQQKYFLIIIPIISMLIFCLKPLLDIWLGVSNSVEITVLAIVLTCIYLINMSILPVYLFLMAKDHTDKIIIVQFVNVILNSIIIFSLYKLIGFYSVILSVTFAIAVSFILLYYYQILYLNIYLSLTNIEFVKYLFTASILILINSFLSILDISNIAKLLIINLFTWSCSVLIYRYFNLISLVDITLYFGNKSKISKFLIFFFVR